MIQLITGKKGTGKTKILIEKINSAVSATNGCLVCIEKGATIRSSISYKVRWCDTEQFAVDSFDTFYGFVAGMLAGNYDIMAAVMIGGMTPPCAIALATLLFKDKFTKEEREAGPTNFIMGLAFITEGAIPYAAADPVRVLPACIIGSGVAGALSMLFGCTLMAPHGGIFVVPVMGNSLMYLVALVVGTVISTILLGVLKKKIA